MTTRQKEMQQAREKLRQWLVKYTNGCDVQSGWPCGTCAIDLLKDLGLDSNKPEYNEHNDEIDRCNEVWRAILQIRDAK